MMHFLFKALVKPGLVLIIAVLMVSCTQTRPEAGKLVFVEDSINPVKYAKYFQLGKIGDYKAVRILSPWDSLQIISTIVLHPAGQESPKMNDAYTHIETPVNCIATTSGTLVSFLEKLDALQSLRGISDASYIVNSVVAEAYRNKQVENIGSMQRINHEKLLLLKPDITFISLFQNIDVKKVTEVSKICFLADYLEKSPLARAEWIRCIGAFYQKDAMADSIFQTIEADYLRLKEMVRISPHRPTVFDGMFFQGSWYVSGGQSYIAQFYKDAGVNYIWKNDSSTASFPLSFEQIYLACADADFWRITVNNPKDYSMAEMLADDERYSLFKAFRQKKILYCDTRKLPYFEKGIIEPHIILADLIHGFHPGILRHYQPVYYKLLP